MTKVHYRVWENLNNSRSYQEKLYCAMHYQHNTGKARLHHQTPETRICTCNWSSNWETPQSAQSIDWEPCFHNVNLLEIRHRHSKVFTQLVMQVAVNDDEILDASCSEWYCIRHWPSLSVYHPHLLHTNIINSVQSDTVEVQHTVLILFHMIYAKK